MEKDSQVKFGSTKCDFCDQPAVTTRGQAVVCEAHADRNVKAANDAADVPLRAAPITMIAKHRG